MKKKSDEFMTIKEAAMELNLALNTVHNGNGGTGHFLRIRQGRCVRLLRQEVLDHKAELIEKARLIRRQINGDPKEACRSERVYPARGGDRGY